MRRKHQHPIGFSALAKRGRFTLQADKPSISESSAVLGEAPEKPWRVRSGGLEGRWEGEGAGGRRCGGRPAELVTSSLKCSTRKTLKQIPG